MNNDNRHSVQDSFRNREEKRCTLVGMTSDVCLSVLKIVTGFVGHSSAILADGIHSIGRAVELMAEAEQLDAHKNAMTVRLTAIKN